ncbi:hypothetical protein [Terrihabitans rhizophilus]|uniref:Uncharacterized protein n=1 Tax=Terrihabitans rhizophilus TaxID=3092662 RepID=A0ABU4RKZ4_9HYPH|nr:hypothetical protein [Terrihabitans sp. PJ23]MDX6804759.1 hypothetical protein [Terrihabitans sp. PJ23]
MSEGTSWPSDDCRSLNEVVGRDISNELHDVVLANERRWDNGRSGVDERQERFRPLQP